MSGAAGKSARRTNRCWSCLALGRLQSGSPRLLPFDQIENPLTRLLEEFGPPRKSIHPELPFYHLQTDGVWVIDEQAPLTRRRGSKNPLRTELRKWKVGGGFTPQLYRELKDRPESSVNWRESCWP